MKYNVWFDGVYQGSIAHEDAYEAAKQTMIDTDTIEVDAIEVQLIQPYMVPPLHRFVDCYLDRDNQLTYEVLQ